MGWSIGILIAMAIAERSKDSHIGTRYSRIGVHIDESDDVWEEEIEAIKDIKSGKTKTETQTSDEFLKELKELENAQSE